MTPYILLIVLILILIGIRMIRKAWRAGISDYEKRRAVEYETAEDAPWMGKTGLSEEDERELPRYLRREFGEFMDEPGCLRASDLKYLGIQTDQEGRAHFWEIGGSAEKETYAYVDIDNEGNALCLGWGGRTPPQPAAYQYAES